MILVLLIYSGIYTFNYYKMNLGSGSLLELKIDFIKSIPTINCIGRIIRIEEETQYNSMFRIATEFTEIDDKEREIINITVESILRKERRTSSFFKKKNLFRRTIQNEKGLDEKIGSSISKVRRIYFFSLTKT